MQLLQILQVINYFYSFFFFLRTHLSYVQKKQVLTSRLTTLYSIATKFVALCCPLASQQMFGSEVCFEKWKDAQLVAERHACEVWLTVSARGQTTIITLKLCVLLEYPSTLLLNKKRCWEHAAPDLLISKLSLLILLLREFLLLFSAFKWLICNFEYVLNPKQAMTVQRTEGRDKVIFCPFFLC